MRPHEKGIMLEGLGEMHTAADAMKFTLDMAADMEAEGDTPELTAEHLANIARIASNVRISCIATERALPSHTQMGEVNHHITSQYGSEVVRATLGLAAQHHPDELVRQSAQGMLRSYEESVFKGAMGNSSTPEA